MAALTQDRHTPQKEGAFLVIPVAASTKIFVGALVAINATGYAVPGSVATTLKGAGVAEDFVDNSSGSAGDKSVKVRLGVYRFGNSADADLIALKDRGASCYIVDDQTVALTNGSNTRSVAGKIHDVDAQGVWVLFS